MGNGKKMALIYAIIVFVVFVIVDVAYLSFASNNIKRKYAVEDSETVEKENEKAKFDPEETSSTTTEEDTTDESTSGIEITEESTTEPSTEESTTQESTSETVTVTISTSSTTEDEPLVSVISGTTSGTTGPTTVQTQTQKTTSSSTTKKTTQKTTKKTSGGGGTKTASSSTRTSTSSKKTIKTVKTTQKTTTTMKPASYSSGRTGANASWEWIIKTKVDDIRSEKGLENMQMAEALRNEAEELAYYYLNHKASELSAKVEEYAQQTGYTIGFRAHKEYGINPSNGGSYLANKITADKTAKLYSDYMYYYVGIGVMHAKTSSGELLDTAVMIYRYGE